MCLIELIAHCSLGCCVHWTSLAVRPLSPEFLSFHKSFTSSNFYICNSTYVLFIGKRVIMVFNSLNL